MIEAYKVGSNPLLINGFLNRPTEEDDHFLDFFDWHAYRFPRGTPSCLAPIYSQVVALGCC